MYHRQDLSAHHRLRPHSFVTTTLLLSAWPARSKPGSIVYLDSVHSKVASVMKAPYVTAKHGLLG
jgi:3-hydroxybutyrate dehydrogenase